MATRRIHFYDLRAYKRRKKGGREEVALEPAFKLIRALPALDLSKGQPSRYVEHEDDELLMEIFAINGPEIRGAFAVKRTRDLPRIEGAGAWSDVVLAAGQGIAEIRHFVYWTDRCLLGIEVNRRGPGLTALSDYLKHQAAKPGGFVTLEATIYLAHDQFDRLLASDRISTATIGVRRDDLASLSDIEPALPNALGALAKSNNAAELQIEWRLGDRRADASLQLPLLSKLQSFVGDPEKRQALKTLKAYARDPEFGEMRTIDLLEDRFVGREEVVLRQNGVVERDSMLDAIRRAVKSIDAG